MNKRDKKIIKDLKEITETLSKLTTLLESLNDPQAETSGGEK
jgi:hypothetical protein